MSKYFDSGIYLSFRRFWSEKQYFKEKNVSPYFSHYYNSISIFKTEYTVTLRPIQLKLQLFKEKENWCDYTCKKKITGKKFFFFSVA